MLKANIVPRHVGTNCKSTSMMCISSESPHGSTILGHMFANRVESAFFAGRTSVHTNCVGTAMLLMYTCFVIIPELSS
jgi:hypothetical protein